MRHFSTLILLLISYPLFSPTLHDKQRVIQACLDLEEIKPYFELAGLDYMPLTIVYYGGTPDLPGLTAMGLPVNFISNHELLVPVDNEENVYMKTVEEYIIFNHIKIDEVKAEINFTFHYDFSQTPKYLKANVFLEKENGNWVVKTKQVRLEY
jgi:hypothetical protein